MQSDNLPQKAHRLLIFTAAIFFLILARIFYLSSFMHDHFLAKAQKPQHSMQVRPALRGKMYDRFGHLLATNRLQYNAAILYDDIRAIPRVSWQRNSQGKKVKVYERKNYIQNLSQTLSSYLPMSAEAIEDKIHAKAAIFPGTPCVIATGLDETTYAKLKMQERLLPGLHMQKGVVRVYPKGKVGGSILGYLGAINQQQYYQISSEINTLKTYLKSVSAGIATPLPKGFNSLQEVSSHLESLLEKMYTMNTQVGKSGLEKALEHELRGIPGKTGSLMGRGGVHLGSLPVDKPEVNGKMVSLSLSYELQEFAEKLLIHHEGIRRTGSHFTEPWIKGGAIVAMVPKTGEIVAMASYPRMDPNDFTLNVDSQTKAKRNKAVHKWIESKTYGQQLFQGLAYLEKEEAKDLSKPITLKQTRLTWPLFLNYTLSQKSQVLKILSPTFTLGQALSMQEAFHEVQRQLPEASTQEILSDLSGDVKAELKPWLAAIPSWQDRCLLFDLLRLAANSEHMDPALLGPFSKLTLTEHHDLKQAFYLAEKAIYEASYNLFEQEVFASWRKDHFTDYLALKREEEKAKKISAKPYTHHLQFAKKNLFKTFWQQHKWSLITTYLFEEMVQTPDLKALSFHLLLMSKAQTSSQITALKKMLASHTKAHSLSYLKGIHAAQDLSFTLYATYPSMLPTYNQKGYDLCRAFLPKYGFGFGKPFTHAQNLPTGSIFKIVTAYEGLRTCQDRDPSILNPLTLIDQIHTFTRGGRQIPALGKWMDGASIPRYYKGGRLPKSYRSLGPLNLTGAFAKSSNLYFSILAGDYIPSFSHLLDSAHLFGFGTKTGIELTNEKRGFLPTDLRGNKTGLYAFSIGQHTLLSTPLQTACCLSAVANHGQLIQPTLIGKMTSHSSSIQDLFSAPSYPFAKELTAFGLPFPLFSESVSPIKREETTHQTPTLSHSLHMPSSLYNPLTKGLKHVVQDIEGTCHLSKIQSLLDHPQWRKIYRNMSPYVMGKSSSAEFTYKAHLDRQTSAQLTQDIWFAGVSFSKEEEPELTVVVYLHFGDYGKEAAPLALLVMDKYRNLCKHYDNKPL